MKNKIILEALKQFLNEPNSAEIINGCDMPKGAQWLNAPLKIKVDKISDEEIKIEIENNGKNGFTRYEKTYRI